jgi:formylglycine-generating enzyme required for sulfatase activity
MLLLLLLLQGTEGWLPAQEARDVQAGGMSIIGQCEVMERRVTAQWEVLEKLLSDWISKEQPDLPVEWAGLSAGLENLRRESDLKNSATGGDLAREMTDLRRRIADLNAKLASVPEETRRDAAAKVRQVEGRIGALEKAVQSLATVCGSTRTKLDALKDTFEVNIQLEGAAKARETLRQKVGDLLVEIRRKRGDAVGAMAGVPAPVPAGRESVVTKEKPFLNSLGLEFLPLPGKPGVLMSRTETRVRDFDAFVRATGYEATEGAYTLEKGGWKQVGGSWMNPGFPKRSAQTGDHPVVCVSWEDARAFCEWLSRQEGRRYRLPTDAEWSAAVGGQEYPWKGGFPPPPGAGNYAGIEANTATFKAGRYEVIGDYDDGAERTAPVGSYPPNAFGFHDLGGNVWEWCEDWFQLSMGYPEVQKVLRDSGADEGDPNQYRVLRGGSWFSFSEISLRSGCRARGRPDSRGGANGFRIVLEAPSGP